MAGAPLLPAGSAMTEIHASAELSPALVFFHDAFESKTPDSRIVFDSVTGEPSDIALSELNQTHQ